MPYTRLAVNSQSGMYSCACEWLPLSFVVHAINRRLNGELSLEAVDTIVIVAVRLLLLAV